MSCLDENTIASYLGRRLDQPQVAETEAHLAECSACRDLVDDLAFAFAASVDGAPTEPAANEPIAPGHTIDRYVILRPLGAGAFGVVYAAYDPELDRKIALKRLRTGSLGTPDHVLREARAMARLSHPHVTAVYDVYSEGDRVWIAMELVPGQTMAEWLAERPRPLEAVLDAFTQAGRGLAAAHEAGLMHGDFKPANVLMTDAGHISVTDFGLARLLPSRDGSNAPEGGAGAGTPRYMAPEQYAAHAASPLADQFSFAVALYEALCDAHPFEGQLPEAVQKNRRAAPPASLPRWLKRILDRALELSPQNRFPSMIGLVDALSRDRRRRRRQMWTAALIAAGVMAMAGARVYDTHRREARLCTGGPEAVRAVWNPISAARLEAAWTLGSNADPPGPRIRRRLDAHFAKWQTQFTEVCKATRVRGEQSDRAMAARMRCLNRAKSEAAALVTALSEPPKTNRLRPIDAVLALTPLEDCADVASLLAPETPPARLRRAVESVERTLAEIRAIRNSGQLERAHRASQTALDTAQALDHAPLMAKALLSMARSQSLSGQLEDAEHTLERAIEAAARGHHDRVAAETWIERIYVGGALRSEEALALGLAPAAAAALLRIDDPPRLRARLDSTMGFILASYGQLTDALTHHQRALSTYAEVYGPDSPTLGLEYHRLAEVWAELGFISKARAAAERAQTILAATYGAAHPRLALPLEILARADCEDGRLRACATKARRAMTLRLQGGDAQNHPAFLPKLLILAKTVSEAERVVLLSSAAELAETHFGPNSPWLGRIRLLQEDAKAGVAILKKSLPPHHPDRAEAERDLARLERAVGPNSPRLVPLLLTQGQLDRAAQLAEAGGRAQWADVQFHIAQTRHDRPRAEAALAHWQKVQRPEKADPIHAWLNDNPLGK